MNAELQQKAWNAFQNAPPSDELEIEAVLRVAIEGCCDELRAFARSKINAELITEGLLLNEMASHIERKFLDTGETNGR